MAKAQIGSLTLGDTPRVVAIIDELVALSQIEKLPERGADLIEVRFDRFVEPLDTVIDFIKDLRQTINLPIIGTIRETRSNRSRRRAMFDEILPLVECIDIEIDAEIRSEVINAAAGKTIIVSEHNFECTPSYAALEEIVKKAVSYGADIVKIATMATSQSDVTRLLRFNEDHDEPMVTIAMGDQGMVSRVVASLFGSLFTYGYTTRPAASGQLSLEGLVEVMRTLFPAYDRQFDQYAL